MKIKRRSKLRSNRRFYQRKKRTKQIRSRKFIPAGDFNTISISSRPKITPEELYEDDPAAEKAVELLTKTHGAWYNDFHIAVHGGVVTETDGNGHTVSYPLSEANIKEIPNET